MAPEEQMTTRWPSRRRPTAVSTMVDKVLRRGSWVFSSTMDDVPVADWLVGAVLTLVLGPYFYLPSLITMVRWRFILPGVLVRAQFTTGCFFYALYQGMYRVNVSHSTQLHWQGARLMAHLDEQIHPAVLLTWYSSYSVTRRTSNRSRSLVISVRQL